MHKLLELKEMLMKELEELTKKGELSAGSLDAVDKLTHSIKSICYIIEEMEDEEGYSGARGGRGRGRNTRRDSMGRYAEGGSYREGGSSYRDGESSYRDGGSYREGGSSYRDGGSYREGGRGGRSGRYSRDEAKEEIVEQLRELEMDAKDEETRRMVQKWIKQAEQD